MKRYYVEFAREGITGTDFLYLTAHSKQQIKDMFVEYTLIKIDLLN